MKKFILLAAAAAAVCVFCPAARAALTAGGITALDGSGKQRTAFTNLETIALHQQVNNSADSSDMIRFTFTIFNPSGGPVFRHDGNSTRAVPGNSNSQVSLPISRFYSLPGTYTFEGKAALAGFPEVRQLTTFSISSPNVNLIYPPFGARELADKPLTFRWVGSGASSYRIIVSASVGLYDPLQTGSAASGMFTYPEDPGQDREKLVPGQVYYWKVEGLDYTGAKIAESSVYNFSLKSQASSQTRNVAMLSLDLTEQAPDFNSPLKFRAVVKNTGSNNEPGLNVRLNLSGLPADGSPKSIGETLIAGGQREIFFQAYMPPGQSEGLAVACVDIFDEYIPDNCKTRLVTKNTGEAAASGGEQKRNLTYQEIWEEVLKRLGPEAAKALEGYTFDTIECGNCSPGELNEMMLALMQGSASLTGATVVELNPAGRGLAAPGETQPEGLEPEQQELLADLMPQDKDKQDEWSGYTAGMKAKEPAFYIAQSPKEWAKVWKTVSNDEAPEVDFREKAVVGIIAGTGSKADTVRILSRRRKAEAIVFDYYITETTAETRFVPYIFKVVDKLDGKVEFQRLDVGSK